MKIDSIVLGGGCFWCLDALYNKVEGIINITSGYSGGDRTNPSYEEVCSGNTGHAEVVELEFNSEIVSLETILKIFFDVHDPTTLNRQDNDSGTQYRSVIYCKDENQINISNKVRDNIQIGFKNPIVTQIELLKDFYPAEEYHQDYYRKNPDQPYCVAVISPKLKKFLKKTES